MKRPFALLGAAAYGALALCAALGPEAARPLMFLCLGAGLAACAGRAAVGFWGQRRNIWSETELSEETPGALSAYRGLAWAALALWVAGACCGLYSHGWQRALPWQQARQSLTLRAQVLDYPEERYHRYYYKLRVTAAGEPGQLEDVSPVTFRLSAVMPLACAPGDWVECAVTVVPFQAGGLYSARSTRLADGFQAGGYLSQYQGVTVEKGDVATPSRLLAELRRQVSRSFGRLLPRREAGLLRAMVLGDGSALNETDRAAFQELGVSHVLVVSGMHMTVLAAFLQLFLRRFSLRRAVANLLVALALGLFVALSGFQPSACRGAAMYGVLLLAGSTGRRADGLNSLGLATLAVCLFNPFAGGDLGFALSVTATLGIVCLLRPLERAFGRRPHRRWWNPVASSLAATAAALLGTFPVQLAVFGGFPLLLPLANLLVVAPSTALLYLAFAGAFLSLHPATAALGAPFLWGAAWAGRLLLWLAGTLSQRKGVFLPLTGGAALVAVTALLLLLLGMALSGRDKPLRRVLALSLGAVTLAAAVAQGWAGRGAVFALPATQGESCVILVEDGRAAVLSLGGFQTSQPVEVLRRHQVRVVETLCLPEDSPEARAAAAQILAQYPVERLVLPSGAYLGRDLELELGETSVARLQGGESLSLLPGVEGTLLPRWEGLALTVHGVATVVEWQPARAQSCQLLLTNQGETRVNAPLSLWQSDGIIGENGPAPAGVTAPVEEGCLVAAVSPAGTVSVRREG